MIACLMFCIAIASATAPAPARTDSAKQMFQQVDVFISGRDGYAAYRIPAIETAPDGSLLAFAEGRKYNMADPGFEKQEIDLVMKRSVDRGATWSAMTIVEHAGERWSAANPCTLVDSKTHTVWLFYLRGRPGRNTYSARPGTDDVRILARTSRDNGITWSEPIDLTSATRDMSDPNWHCSVIGPGGGIQTRRGRLLIPVWRYAPWGVCAAYSDDHGRTWKRGEFVPNVEGDECQLVELADGRILFDIRQQKGANRYRALSSDGGQTWSQPRRGETVTPVCCAIQRLTRRPGGDNRNRLLWTGPKGPDRRNLVARLSYDEGETFTREREIASGFAAYSDIALLKDKTAGILWERGETAGYQFISFTRLNRAWLEEPESKNAYKKRPRTPNSGGDRAFRSGRPPGIGGGGGEFDLFIHFLIEAEPLAGMTDAEARNWATDYGKQRWDRSRLKQCLSEAFAWGREHRIPLYCGDLGIYALNAPSESRKN